VSAPTFTATAAFKAQDAPAAELAFRLRVDGLTRIRRKAGKPFSDFCRTPKKGWASRTFALPGLFNHEGTPKEERSPLHRKA